MENIFDMYTYFLSQVNSGVQQREKLVSDLGLAVWFFHHFLTCGPSVGTGYSTWGKGRQKGVPTISDESRCVLLQHAGMCPDPLFISPSGGRDDSGKEE